jgi:hypothetical protein
MNIYISEIIRAFVPFGRYAGYPCVSITIKENGKQKGRKYTIGKALSSVEHLLRNSQTELVFITGCPIAQAEPVKELIFKIRASHDIRQHITFIGDIRASDKLPQRLREGITFDSLIIRIKDTSMELQTSNLESLIPYSRSHQDYLLTNNAHKSIQCLEQWRPSIDEDIYILKNKSTDYFDLHLAHKNNLRVQWHVT